MTYEIAMRMKENIAYDGSAPGRKSISVRELTGVSQYRVTARKAKNTEKVARKSSKSFSNDGARSGKIPQTKALAGSLCTGRDLIRGSKCFRLHFRWLDAAGECPFRDRR